MFDAYASWLGIPKDLQPPSLYQLLGIEPTEKDLSRIEEAAEKRMAAIRSHQGGPHAESCTLLLDEIARARDTLLNPSLRQKYDTLLSAERASGGKKQEPQTVREPKTIREVRRSSAPPSGGVNGAPDARPPPARRLLFRLTIGLVVLVLAIALAFLVFQRGGCQAKDNERVIPNKTSKPDPKTDDRGALFPYRDKLTRPSPDKSSITAVACSLDARYVSFSYGMGTVVVDLWAKAVQIKHPLTNAGALALSADAVYLAVALPNSVVHIEMAQDLRTDVSTMPHKGPSSALAFSADAKHIVTGSISIGGKVENAKKGKPEFSMTLWESVTGKQIQTYLGHSTAIDAVAFTEDGQHVLSASSDKGISRWDLAKGSLVRADRGKTPFDAVAFRPDGKFALCIEHKGQLVLWDVDKGTESARIPIAEGDSAFSVAISGNGKVGVVGLDKDIQVFDLASGKEIARLSGHEAAVRLLAVSADGGLIISASDDGTARTWQKRTH